MQTKIIEATNNNFNWGKFMLCRPDSEWERSVRIDWELTTKPLLQVVGWTHRHLWVLDLQTGEGICVLPGGCAQADLEKHKVWVCPLFEPFLAWLYQQDLNDIAALPDTINLPDAEPALYGYRRGS